MHRHLKSALRARLTGPNWLDELPWVLLGIRTSPKEDIGTSSAELVFGAPLTVPGDFISASLSQSTGDRLRQLRNVVGGLAPVPTSSHGRPAVSLPAELSQAKYVWTVPGPFTG